MKTLSLENCGIMDRLPKDGTRVGAVTTLEYIEEICHELQKSASVLTTLSLRQSDLTQEAGVALIGINANAEQIGKSSNENSTLRSSLAISERS